MRERKYIKFRSDMYNDTKFKIIDMKPERDLIHYAWTRVVTLAGKVNLYMSKNLPYTIETLAIEFNRSEEQIKLALDVFIELEMVELIECRVYRIRNFAKHQNIKVKEKIKSEDKENDRKDIELVMKEASKNEMCENEEKEFDNKVSGNKATGIGSDGEKELEVTNSEIGVANNIIKETIINSSQDNISMDLNTKKNKTANRKKKKDEHIDVTDGDVVDDNIIGWFPDGESLVDEDNRVIMNMAF